MTIEYKDFLRIIHKLLDEISKHEARAVLLLDNVAETADLHFQQDAEFRVDDLLILTFAESKVDYIKAAISHRINSDQQMNMLVQERIKDICKIIEQKNPTLMKEIKKGSQTGFSHINQGQKIDIN